MLLKVCLNSSDQMNSFFVRRSGRRGAMSVARADVLDESWFTSPMNERRSVLLDGSGNLAIACVMEGSIWYPSAEMFSSNVPDGCANPHLDVLSVMRFSLHRLRNCLTYSVWCCLS